MKRKKDKVMEIKLTDAQAHALMGFLRTLPRKK